MPSVYFCGNYSGYKEYNNSKKPSLKKEAAKLSGRKEAEFNCKFS